MPDFSSIVENFEEYLDEHSKKIRDKRLAIRQELASKFQLDIDGELAKSIARLLVPFHSPET
jgi:hypothetical protein